MATFGKPPPEGGTEMGSLAQYVRVCKFTLSEDGDVTEISVYTKGQSGTVACKACIYNDSGGHPSGKECESAEVTVGAAFAWVDFTVSPAHSLTAGVYHIGIFPSITDNVRLMYDAGTTDQTHLSAAQTYPTFPDPFGTYQTADRDISMYATYTPSGAGLSIPVAMHHYGHHIGKIIRG